MFKAKSIFSVHILKSIRKHNLGINDLNFSSTIYRTIRNVYLYCIICLLTLQIAILIGLITKS